MRVLGWSLVAFMTDLVPTRGAAEPDGGNKYWFSVADSLVKLTLDSGYKKCIYSRVASNPRRNNSRKLKQLTEIKKSNNSTNIGQTTWRQDKPIVSYYDFYLTFQKK